MDEIKIKRSISIGNLAREVGVFIYLSPRMS